MLLLRLEQPFVNAFNCGIRWELLRPLRLWRATDQRPSRLSLSVLLLLLELLLLMELLLSMGFIFGWKGFIPALTWDVCS